MAGVLAYRPDRSESAFVFSMTGSYNTDKLIVTGSGGRLGRAYVHGLAPAGAAVVVNDLDGDVAKDTVESIVSRGGRAVAEVAR
ncbi:MULTISPECIES: hypothetical protein [unclassified Rhodococcus (in: high G+C Gram-positive bacteria)]|uniref:hypothetical protein n=1 Tax=unclassified Rhodococcus (in: high G+C Gram-positive bacteria) TaxID=192944 RepID=UPI001BB31351|nr:MULTISPECIES: hypothetical protein [unclassified Rhodococcus (in: high G+C Gram-positive bacteria)]